MGNILILSSTYNTGKKKDATGAFMPEAEAFRKSSDARRVVLIDNRMPFPKITEAVKRELMSVTWDTVAFFCHGSRRGIQLGFDQKNVDELARSLASVTNVRVELYACLAGETPNNGVGGDGGFADLLRDALCRAGAVDCQVDGHTTAGHTSRNPFLRRFLGMGSKTGGVGGFFIVPPKSKLWAKWRRALRDTDLKYQFPFLTAAQIHEKLEAMP